MALTKSSNPLLKPFAIPTASCAAIVNKCMVSQQVSAKHKPFKEEDQNGQSVGNPYDNNIIFLGIFNNHILGSKVQYPKKI